MTHERAFSRHPFQNIEARTSLKIERTVMDLQLDTAKRNLMETKEELVVARNVGNDNAQEAIDSEAQITFLDNLSCSQPRKTIDEYQIILDKIDHYKDIQTQYNEGQLKLNRTEELLLTRERALTNAILAVDTFKTIHTDRLKKIIEEETNCKEAIWFPVSDIINRIPDDSFIKDTNKANRKLQPYAMEAIYWVIYLNGAYAIRELCTFMGLSSPHHNVEHAIYLLVKFNILIRTEHASGEYIYGLVPSLNEHVASTEAPMDIVWKHSRLGWDKIRARSKAAIAAKRKRSTEIHLTDYEDTEDDEASTNKTDSETSVDESHNSRTTTKKPTQVSIVTHQYWKYKIPSKYQRHLTMLGSDQVIC